MYMLNRALSPLFFKEVTQLELLKNKQFTQVKNNNIHLIYYKKELLGIYIINKKVLYYSNSKIFFCGDYNRIEGLEVTVQELEYIFNNIRLEGY